MLWTKFYLCLFTKKKSFLFFTRFFGSSEIWKSKNTTVFEWKFKFYFLINLDFLISLPSKPQFKNKSWNFIFSFWIFKSPFYFLFFFSWISLPRKLNTIYFYFIKLGHYIPTGIFSGSLIYGFTFSDIYNKCLDIL